MNSSILSLVSPVLRKMICGNFRESRTKEIILDDVDAERLTKLLQLACGKYALAAVDVEELLDLGKLAERLEMEAVRTKIEDKLSKELRVENCLRMHQFSEENGLRLLQKECFKLLRDEFRVISQLDGFLSLSEETMGSLLDEKDIGTNQEEDVFEAVVRWMTCCDERERGEGLLKKIRYGVISNVYLAGLTASALLPGHGMLKQLVGEAMTKKGVAGGAGMWDGVERLCEKWTVVRCMKGRIIGPDVLKFPNYVAMDGEGRTVVSDRALDEIILFDLNGSVVRRFGSKGSAEGQFSRPQGVAVDRQGHIIVADYGNNRIQVLNADGSVARCFGCDGTADGQVHCPTAVAIDRKGHVVVAGSSAGTTRQGRIQVFDADGSVVRHFRFSGAAAGVAVDGAGRVVLADPHNHRVQVLNGDGSVVLRFGSLGNGPGQLKCPAGVAVDSMGRFVVADTGNDRVQVFNSNGSVEHIIGSAGDGVGELKNPCGVVVNWAGHIVVAERGNHRVQVL